MATLFALYAGITDGFTAVVISQAGAFAEANRQLVKYIDLFTGPYTSEPST